MSGTCRATATKRNLAIESNRDNNGMFDISDLQTLIWLLAIIAIHVASWMAWGLIGLLFAFGIVFLSWEAMRQLKR